MSVGRGLVKKDIDDRAAAVVEQVWGALNNASQMSAWLANTNIITDTILTNLGYTSGEITLLRAAVNDIGSANGLYGVAHGTKTQPAVNNFFFNAQQITGVNYTG